MNERQPRYQQAGQHQPQQSSGMQQQGGRRGQRRQGTQGQHAMQTRSYQRVPSREFGQFAPSGIREAVLDLDEFETVAAWAHTRAMEQGQHLVGTITDHLAEIAHLEKRLILGRSPFAGTVAHCTEGSIQQSIPHLQQFSGDPVVQEVLEHARYVGRTLGQNQQLLHEWGEMQRAGRMGQASLMGQPGGQQRGGGQGGVQREQY